MLVRVFSAKTDSGNNYSHSISKCTSINDNNNSNMCVQRVVYVWCMEGSDAPIIIPAVFTMHCRAFLLQSVLLPPHTLVQLERMRSMVPLQNVVMMGGGALAYLSLRRKLDFLSQLCGVGGPGEVLADVHHPGR